MSIAEKTELLDASYEKQHPEKKTLPFSDTDNLISISQFSELADINRDTLVYYIKEKLITPAITKKNGYQYFYPDQLRTITFIKYMRRFGIHIHEIRSMLVGMDEESMDRILDSHCQEIEHDIQSITHSLQFLEQYHEFFDFIENHTVDTPFFCNLKEINLYLTPVRFCHSLNNAVNAGIISDFLEFEEEGLPEYLLCCKIPETVLIQENFCALMHNNAGPEPEDRIISRPAGKYACIIHRGGTYTIKEMVQSLKEHISRQEMEPAGDAYILSSAGYFNLLPADRLKFLIEIPVNDIPSVTAENEDRIS